MTHDIQSLAHWLRVCLLIAAACTTVFPILYSFSKWHVSALGRILMFQAVSFAFTLDVTALFQYWHPHDILVIFWVEAIAFTLIAISTALLIVMLCYINYYRPHRPKIRK